MRFVLLGDPVDHSRSPRIHNAALAAAGIAGIYTVRRVDEPGFREAMKELRSGTWEGANVTMPHKRLAWEAADVHDRAAAVSGAVNTLVTRDGVLRGYNTDVSGLRRAWQEASLPASGSVLILGAGGAAAAAATALAGFDLFISARSGTAAEALGSRFGARPVPWGSGPAGAIVVNATPLGMAGESLPDGALEAAPGLVDFAYGTDPTPAVIAARIRGIPAVDGVTLLVAQAADAFEIWTSRPAPVEAMQQAVAAG